ncbi:MAG: ABC transporter permease [Chloroflexota bacterium]|nr:ABC transporter permease [Chloroflexota bacterium]
MIAYIIRRLLHAAVVVVVVSMMVFVVMRLLPGDPVLMYLTSGDLQSASPQQIAQLRHDYGLDKPLVVQYVDWAGHVLHGDLGKSILFHYSVTQELARRFPISLSLALMALVIGILIGPLLGAVSAIRRGTWLDTFLTVMATVGITAPSFWVGIIMIYVLGLKLGLLPIYGYTSPLADLGASVRQSIMPVAVLAVFPIASAARQTRSSVLEVVGQDYIRTAWSKGLSERVVVARHVLKNALMPVATIQGEILRNIVAGAVVVETVFVIPGMGRLLVNGMLSSDYPVVEGIILLVAVVVVMANLLVDILYAWLDPRIQYR